jgi:hypothetical protein
MMIFQEACFFNSPFRFEISFANRDDHQCSEFIISNNIVSGLFNQQYGH